MPARTLKPQLIELLPRLKRYALTLTRSDADADDLVQETCWRALTRAHQWDPTQDLGKWVFRIARNLWLNEIRTRRVRLGEGHVDAEEEQSLYTTSTGETQLAGRQMQDLIRQLPSDLSIPLLLVAAEGHSYKEVAAHLDIPIGTVMSRVARARRQLKASFEAA